MRSSLFPQHQNPDFSQGFAFVNPDTRVQYAPPDGSQPPENVAPLR